MVTDLSLRSSAQVQGLWWRLAWFYLILSKAPWSLARNRLSEAVYTHTHTHTHTHSCIYICCLVAQSCPTLCNSVDCSPPGSSVHGLLQARTLEWVAISFSRRSSCLRDWTRVSCIDRWVLYHWAIKDAWKRYIDVLWKVAKARKVWTRQKKRGGPESWVKFDQEEAAGLSQLASLHCWKVDVEKMQELWAGCS